MYCRPATSEESAVTSTFFVPERLHKEQHVHVKWVLDKKYLSNLGEKDDKRYCPLSDACFITNANFI